MPNRIMLVIGSCGQEDYSAIQESVLDKLTKAEETGIRFCKADEMGSDEVISESINGLVGNVDPDIHIDNRIVDVVAVFDGRAEEAEHLRMILSKLEALRAHIGIWGFNFHIIWLAEEYPHLRYTYADLLETLASGDNAFRYIYFLSDKHSDLRYGKDVRISGASLLLSTIQNAKSIDPGFYTVGVGKNRITAVEMRNYAKHYAVNALQSQMLRWTGFSSLDDICASAFTDEIENEAYLFPWLMNLMNGRMTSSFAYIKGETSRCTKPEPLFSLDFDSELEIWAKHMKEYIRRIPFVEKVLEYLQENSGLDILLDRMEKQFFSYQTFEAKPGLFSSGEQKEVIREFNQFHRINQEEVRNGWTAFRQQMKGYVHDVIDEAEACIKQRDEMLGRYTRDDQFLQQCETVAGESIREIQRKMAGLEISRDRFLSFGKEEGFTESKAEKMMNWIAEETCRNIHPEDIISGMAVNDIGQLVTQVFSPVISKARVYFACPFNDHLDTPTTVFLYIPEKLYRDNIPLQAQIIPVLAAEYQNVEAMALLKLNTGKEVSDGAYRLTAFQGKAVFSAAPVTTRSGRIKQESYGEKKDAVQIQEVNEEQETFNNPWNISVKPDSYQATFSWEDSSISLVSVRLENEDGYSQTMTLKQGAFMVAGTIDLEAMVDYGVNTVSLVSGGRVLSKTTFVGRRHQIDLDLDQTEYKLDQNHVLQKVTLKVAAVDGDSRIQVANSICSGMRILLNNKDYLEMPQPWEKHKQQGWTVIMDSDTSFRPVFSSAYESKYQFHLN